MILYGLCLIFHVILNMQKAQGQPRVGQLFVPGQCVWLALVWQLHTHERLNFNVSFSTDTHSQTASKAAHGP